MSEPEPPVPPDQRHNGADREEPTPTQDMREEFARISRRSPPDPEAERAFIESKIEMIRTHPTLSEEEKETAIAELLTALRGQADDTDPGTSTQPGGEEK